MALFVCGYAAAGQGEWLTTASPDCPYPVLLTWSGVCISGVLPPRVRNLPPSSRAFFRPPPGWCSYTGGKNHIAELVDCGRASTIESRFRHAPLHDPGTRTTRGNSRRSRSFCIGLQRGRQGLLRAMLTTCLSPPRADHGAVTWAIQRKQSVATVG